MDFMGLQEIGALVQFNLKSLGPKGSYMSPMMKQDHNKRTRSRRGYDKSAVTTVAK